MRYVTVAPLLLAVAMAGCKKPEGPTVAEPPVVEKPLTTITPVDTETPAPLPEAERPRPVPLDELAPPPVTGETEISVPAPSPRYITHVVQKNDTLWSLAKRYLGSGRRWQEIVAANPGVEPQRLRVGMTLRIPVD